jgi:hypothetical protein
LDAPALPDRITVSRCIACGAMGRAAACAEECSEHRLPLVAAGELDQLREAARRAEADLRRLRPVLEALLREEPPEPECPGAFSRLRRAALDVLPSLDPRGIPSGEDATPRTVIGWWCAECGNVDAPQPCLGVCIWRPVDFVNADVCRADQERCLETLRSARAARATVAKVAALTPKRGRCTETWRSLKGEASV